MYCKKCGKKLPDGSKFCGVCGAKQDSQIVQQSLKSKELKRSQYGLKTPILLIGIFIVTKIAGASEDTLREDGSLEVELQVITGATNETGFNKLSAR